MIPKRKACGVGARTVKHTRHVWTQGDTAQKCTHTGHCQTAVMSFIACTSDYIDVLNSPAIDSIHELLFSARILNNTIWKQLRFHLIYKSSFEPGPALTVPHARPCSVPSPTVSPAKRLRAARCRLRTKDNTRWPLGPQQRSAVTAALGSTQRRRPAGPPRGRGARGPPAAPALPVPTAVTSRGGVPLAGPARLSSHAVPAPRLPEPVAGC